MAYADLLDDVGAGRLTPEEAQTISSIVGKRGARRKADYIALTKAARARFDTLAAQSIEAVFQAVLTAATQASGSRRR